MSRIISPFHVYLFKLKKTYQESKPDTPFKKALLSFYTEVLQNYDEYTSKSFGLKKLFRDYIHDLPKNIEYAIVFLIFIDMIGDEKLRNIDFEITKSIVEAFIKEKVGPSYFYNYLNLFFDNAILQKLEILWCISNDPLSDHLIKIISAYSPQVTDFYYTKITILEYLCALIREPFSPLLKGRFTIFGIKEQLRIELSSIPSTDEEIKTLDLLNDIKVTFDKDKQEKLLEEVKCIETEFINQIKGYKSIGIKSVNQIEDHVVCQKEKAIRSMTRKIRLFYYSNSQHMSLLPQHVK